MDSKTFLRILSLSICSKKCKGNSKWMKVLNSLMTLMVPSLNERNYLLNGLQNLLKDFCLLCFQKAKETEDTSADYQVKEIICSMDFKTS